ncbi:MAG: DUF4838 domain-containing protein [Clostridia bacterium]|nr:DUF4838 domain-containing protein [Clostridia bacterium]
MSKYCIANHGESIFHIVNHQYSDETVRYAASELQKYLLKATNTAIPYFSDRCPMRGPEIRIGANVRGETCVESDLREDGFCIRAAGEHITITASTSRGVLYGVYRFLEIFCNYRCFTKSVERIDTFDTLEIELDEIVEEPAFECRDAYFRDAFDGDFAVKNHLNASLCDLSVAKGGRIKWFNFHHSFRDLIQEELYFDEHPEYFSEIDGQRVKNSQPCLTNHEVLKIAEASLREWIVNNPECKVFSVAQNDNRNRCRCKNCMAVEKEEGSPAGPIIRFVNKLADKIKDEYPHVLLHTFAYQYSLPAPKKAVARDNVIVRLCSISCRFDTPFEVLASKDPQGAEAIFVNALKDWKDHASKLYVWDYAVNFRNYFQPFIHFHTLAENIRFFQRIGVRGMLQQGNFAYGGGSAFDGLKAYLISRLLWNPQVDIDDETDRFLVGVYGKESAVYIKKYLSTMESACCGNPLSIYQFPDAEYITDELVAEADKLFKKAIEAAGNDACRERLEREYLSVRFLKLTRSDLNEENRDILIDDLFEDIKHFGITEIRERVSLSVSKRCMKNHRYVKDRSEEYKLYYIMQ